MKTKKRQSAVATKPKRQQPPAPAKLSPEADRKARAMCGRYIQLFGLEMGPLYFCAGLSVDEARTAFRSRPAYAERLEELTVNAGLGALAALAAFTEEQGRALFASGPRYL